MTDGQIVTLLNRLAAHYGPQQWWSSDNPVLDLLSMVLIQRTTERNAQLAMEHFDPKITLQELAELPLVELQARIRPAGFFTAKSQTIKALTAWFLSYGENRAAHLDTADLRKELLAIKGVGPETADVILLYLFDRPVFVADEYARRLFRRLGLGDYASYGEMHRETQRLAALASTETCKEWHAVIDEHGKAYRHAKGQLDESWLLE